MGRQNASQARCEALFASALQCADAPSTDTVSEAISRTLWQLGPDGCAGRMAQEFGDHPDEARERMQWARKIVYGVPA